MLKNHILVSFLIAMLPIVGWLGYKFGLIFNVIFRIDYPGLAFILFAIFILSGGWKKIKDWYWLNKIEYDLRKQHNVNQ